MSNTEVNAGIRVLSDKRLKYTVRIHKAGGEVLEYQSQHKPRLDFNVEARCLWINDSAYDGAPVCKHEDGMVILCEENPT